MPKLVELSHDEVCRILIAEGFVVVRQTRHSILQNTTSAGTITVPVPTIRRRRFRSGRYAGSFASRGCPERCSNGERSNRKNF